MKFIKFNESAANRLISACNSAASTLAGQNQMRSDVLHEVLRDFSGTYMEVFRRACEIEAGQRNQISAAFYSLADQLEQVLILARREEQRLQERHESLGESVHNRIYGGLVPEDRWSWPIKPCPVHVSFVPLPHPRRADQHSDSTVSADPVRLYNFSADCVLANSKLSDELSAFKRIYRAFVTECSWADVSLSSFLNAVDRFLDENRLDQQWAFRLAQAFERADSNGILNEYVLEASAPQLSDEDRKKMLENTDLTPAQLNQVLDAMSYDLTNHAFIARYIAKFASKKDLSLEDEQRLTAMWSAAANHKYLSKEVIKCMGNVNLLKYSSRTNQEFRAQHRYSEPNIEKIWISQSAAIRNLFQAAQQAMTNEEGQRQADDLMDLALNIKFGAPSTPLYYPVATTSSHIDFRAISGISNLLRDSKLNSGFMLRMGERIQKQEQKTGMGPHTWVPNESPSFPLYKPISVEERDLAVSYMSALKNSPAAAHTFFTTSEDTANKERFAYWTKNRAWGHDGFKNITAAIEAATIRYRDKDNNLPKSSAELTALMVYNFNHREDVFPDSPEENMKAGSLSENAGESLARIIGTYMPSVQLASNDRKNADLILVAPFTIGYEGTFNDMPGFRKDHLAKMLQGIVSTERGRMRWRSMLTEYNQRIFNTVAEKYKGTTQFTEAINETAQWGGRLEGFTMNQMKVNILHTAKKGEESLEHWLTLTDSAFSLATPLFPEGKVIISLAKVASNPLSNVVSGTQKQKDTEAIEEFNELSGKVFSTYKLSVMHALQKYDSVYRDDMTASFIQIGIEEEVAKKWLDNPFNPEMEYKDGIRIVDNENLIRRLEATKTQKFDDQNLYDAYNEQAGK